MIFSQRSDEACLTRQPEPSALDTRCPADVPTSWGLAKNGMRHFQPLGQETAAGGGMKYDDDAVCGGGWGDSRRGVCRVWGEGAGLDRLAGGLAGEQLLFIA